MVQVAKYGVSEKWADEKIQAAVEHYPWFALTQLMAEMKNSQTRLALIARPVPQFMLMPIDCEQSHVAIIDVPQHDALQNSDDLRSISSDEAERTIDQVDDVPGTLEVIDAFLQKGEHRIVPKEGTPECEWAERSAHLDEDDEFLTEELAEIYRQQGLIEKAKEIYRALGLLYPEKSVYFAEIIAEIDDKE